ncbi:nitrate reductase alpha chain domain protein [Mycobacterium xenopi 4042]|uniref:Nitrate reductase alpha chain domain protein n=1 Tax=Mycobacterium xenopi 4042 TaxID=1299334 RepID=X7Z4Z0_MYCXE|nr:nitrate reductase alpha chain domain protein [Mycobacterium xenopi 4042]
MIRRGVPVLRLGEKLVTTVFDLLMAHYAVSRPGLPGEWPTGYDDASQPYTPAWQQAITSVPAAAAAGWPANSPAAQSFPKAGR